MTWQQIFVLSWLVLSFLIRGILRIDEIVTGKDRVGLELSTAARISIAVVAHVTWYAVFAYALHSGGFW